MRLINQKLTELTKKKLFCEKIRYSLRNLTIIMQTNMESDIGNEMAVDPDDQWILVNCYGGDNNEGDNHEGLSFLEALHSQEILSSQKSEIVCYVCGKRFDKLNAYYGHLRKHHKEDFTVCSLCPDARFPSKSKLIDHLSSEHNIKLRMFRCQLCGFAFTSYSKLREHLVNKHGNKNEKKPYPCKSCPASFRKPSDLKKHELTHSKVKQYTCEICDKVFGHQSNFKRHILTHTMEKPYICMTCPRRFAQLSTMKRHTKTCIGNLPVNGATVAPKVPNSSTISIGSRKYHCRECGLQFEYINELNHHYQTKHPQKETKVKNTVRSNIGKSVNALINDLFVEDDINNTKTINNIKEVIQEVPNTNSFIPNIHEYYLTDQNGAVICSHLGSNVVNPTSVAISQDTPVVIPQEPLDSINIANDLINDNTAINNNILLNRGVVSKNTAENNKIEDSKAPFHNIDSNAKEQIFNEDFNPVTFDDLSSHSINFDNFKINYDTIDSIEINDAFNSMNNLDKLHKTIDRDVLDELATKDLFYDEASMDNIFSMQQPDYSTIFEKDIDLDNSSKLAANLNQLIEENKVQYVPTEDDDLFIINLNNSMDADKLTDMLNIDTSAAKSETTNNKEKTITPENITEINTKDECDSDVIVADSEGDFHEISNFRIESNDLHLMISVVDDKKSEKVMEKDCIELIVCDIVDESSIKPEEDKNNKKNDWTCTICSKKFKRKENYLSHKANHNGLLKKFKCHVCMKRYAYYSTMMKHVKKVHTPIVPPSFECDECSISYSAKWMLRLHIERQHLKLRPYKCDTAGCEKVFYRKIDLLSHKRTERKEKPYPCSICRKEFSHVSHMLRHVEHHKMKDKVKERFPHSCGRCKACFEHRADLDAHVEKELCYKKQQVETTGDFVCLKCNATLKSRSQLMVHREKCVASIYKHTVICPKQNQYHKVKKKFLHSCEKCMACFKNQTDLDSHVEKKMCFKKPQVETSADFVCLKCNATLKNQAQLMVHREKCIASIPISATGPVVCATCKATLKNRSELDKHQIKCTEANSRKKVQIKDQYEIYVCKKCHGCFGYPLSLLKHVCSASEEPAVSSIS